MKPNYDDYLKYEQSPVSNPRDPWDAFQAGWNACLARLEGAQHITPADSDPRPGTWDYWASVTSKNSADKNLIEEE